ncbi:MAG: malonate decarboxylase subunit epsilon, partial [Psychrobacter alimentarius]
MSLILLFSGQGLQGQRHIEEVLNDTSAYEQALLKDIMPDLFANEVDSTFAGETIFSNEIAQPFIYTLQYHR